MRSNGTVPLPHRLGGPRIAGRRAGEQPGFTLIELIITTVVVALIMGSAALLFNSMNELSRVQMHQAELQQSVRVAQRELGQFLQMAGRGGLAGNNFASHAANTAALSIRDNVGTAPFGDLNIAEGDADSPLILTDTDVLTVRGVFDSSILHLEYTDRSRFVVAGAAPGTGGTITVSSRTPTGIPQNLEALNEACNPTEPGEPAVNEALVLVNAVNESNYAVVELDCEQSDFGAYVDDVTAVFDVTVAFLTSTARAADYANVAPGGVNPDLTQNFNPAFIGILEEYRYYIRDDTEDGRPSPKLSRARMFPGTELAYKTDPLNLRQDVAEFIFDLQVALGFDSSFDGGAAEDGHFDFDLDNTGDDDRIVDEGNLLDDWLFNAPNEAANVLATVPWIGPWDSNQPQPVLYYARITTIGRTSRPDRGYLAPLLTQLEDRVYETDADDLINGDEARAHRREILQTVIDLRNLG
jgi:prepilin-type N-terminal cleavage/methylation domain-containing protein